MMRAVKPGIHPGASFCQHTGYVAMQNLNIIFGVIPPCHAGLIGDDHDQDSCLIQQPDGLRRSRNKLKILNAEEIFLFLIDRSVSVQKNRTFHIFGFPFDKPAEKH